jgi:hypothetical protein
MLLAICLVLMGFGQIQMQGYTPAIAAGNAGAAHDCAHGGYANLLRLDGTRFSSVGDCVSYVVHGGIPVDVPPCAVVVGVHGCLVMDHVTLPNVGFVSPTVQGSTITLTGTIRFPTNCSQSACTYESPNALGPGAGVYSIQSSSGALLAYGTFTVTGIRGVSFRDGGGSPENCGPLPTQDSIAANIDLVDILSSTTGSGEITVTNTDGMLVGVSLSSTIAGTYFAGPGSALTIQC